MKHLHFIVSLFFLIVGSCSSPKTAQSLIDPKILNGSWEVTELPGATFTMDVLYPEKKPTMMFDVATQKVSGNTSCNSYNGPYKVNGSVIDFTAPMAMTRMACPGDGEATFVNTLQKVNGWTVRDEILRFMSGDLVVMHLKKVE